MAAPTRTRRTGKTPEERAAEVEALAEQLTDAVVKLTRAEAWLGMLRVAARFTRYSPTNVPAAVDAGRAARRHPVPGRRVPGVAGDGPAGRQGRAVVRG